MLKQLLHLIAFITKSVYPYSPCCELILLIICYLLDIEFLVSHNTYLGNLNDHSLTLIA
jgi:hypothetical protein